MDNFSLFIDKNLSIFENKRVGGFLKKLKKFFKSFYGLDGIQITKGEYKLEIMKKQEFFISFSFINYNDNGYFLMVFSNKKEIIEFCEKEDKFFISYNDNKIKEDHILINKENERIFFLKKNTIDINNKNFFQKKRNILDDLFMIIQKNLPNKNSKNVHALCNGIIL